MIKFSFGFLGELIVSTAQWVWAFIAFNLISWQTWLEIGIILVPSIYLFLRRRLRRKKFHFQ